MSEEMQDSIADINEDQLEIMLEDVEVKDEEILDEAKSKSKVEDADDEDDVEVKDDEDEDEEEDEEVVEEVEESNVDFSDDLSALVEGEASLAEGFKDKAALIFEAAISSKLKVEVAKLEESFEIKLEEATVEVRESLVDKVDSYLSYVVEQWTVDNKLAVESGLRTEIAESFMSSLYDVFAEHHIEVPEDKVDLVDELAEQVSKLTGQLNDSVDRGIELTDTIHDHQRVEAIAEATTGMTELDIEKFKGLVESIDFDDTESFTSKIETIKESYFKVTGSTKVQEEELLVVESNDSTISNTMAAYVAAINNNTQF
jgi:hypothetical protein